MKVFKTYEGARKRAAFENAMAKGEFQRGEKAKLYHYEIVESDIASRERGFSWRVVRTESKPQESK
jgi:hypothetical protein